MRKAFVDTSAWFSFVRKDDPDHDWVTAAFEVWEPRLLTTNFILDETVTLIQARLGHALAVRVGEHLQDPSEVELVRVMPEDEEEAWRFFVKHKDQAFSFSDCTSFSVMHRLGLKTALTTDRRFRHAGFEIAG